MICCLARSPFNTSVSLNSLWPVCLRQLGFGACHPLEQLGMAVQHADFLFVPQVSDWWEEYIYLRGRGPLMVNSNYYAMVSWSPFPDATMGLSCWACPWLPRKAQHEIFPSCSCFCRLSLPAAVKSPPGPKVLDPQSCV